MRTSTTTALKHAGARAFLEKRTLAWLGGLALVFVLGGLTSLIGDEIWRRASKDLDSWHRWSRQDLGLSSTMHFSDFSSYQESEGRLFDSMSRLVSRRSEDWPAFSRFDPGQRIHSQVGGLDWNRSVSLPSANPMGGILLLHGLSDSPYSLHEVGEVLNDQGFRVVAPRLPGHGLFPGALRSVRHEEWQHVVSLAFDELVATLDSDQPAFIVGYSNGAALALDLVLRRLLANSGERVPSGLILVSPALSVTRATRLAPVLGFLSRWPGLEGLAWNSVVPEYDPYKYNSFPVNAGYEIFQLVEKVEAGLSRLETENRLLELPPLLTFQSAVDATVPPVESVTRLYRRVRGARSQLVVFDVNQRSSVVDFLKPRVHELIELEEAKSVLPFEVTLVTNVGPDSDSMVAVTRRAGSLVEKRVSLEMEWPVGVYSLSHVALPFSPNDPVYGVGEVPGVGLGGLEVKGERNSLLVPGSLLSRLRYNPFHDYLQRRLQEFVIQESRGRPAF